MAWIHPLVVHFGVALLFVAVTCDVLGLWRANEKLLFAGYWNTVFGALGAILAVVTGLLSEANLGPTSPLGHPLLEFHKIFGFGGTVTAIVLATARIVMRGYIRPKLRTLYLAGAFFGAGLLVITGAIGGTLVYQYGVGIPAATATRVLDAQPRAPEPTNPSPPDAGVSAIDAAAADAGAHLK